ncbi:nucleoside/nucleotide kinase family protein [Mycolicibacterium mengxianglii]|uniref:nucleoside/nucleotide kinase family protein n=1 Tax=Mycolicibacterium mengxianglii TaxID=2736649 RepID=UPI0027DA5A5A|nr:nucleoside/nucleotide kinase family protein [Mycolicibacterium mengxianglii]
MCATTTTEEALQMVTADLAALRQAGASRVLVGITGPPGAGKSTFAETLVRTLGAAYVPMDGFHLSNVQLRRLGRHDCKGATDTFDVDGYVVTLARIAQAYRQADVYVPGFDRAIEEPVAATHVVPADAGLVVTEGNYLGLDQPGWRAVRPLLQRLYYVDCPAAVRGERLVARHVAGGRSLADAQKWADEVDEPNAVLIATTAAGCDRVFEIDE